MPTLLLFHCDENVDAAIAHGLRRRGVDVTTAGEVGMLRASDEEHLRFAREHGRVLVTQDDDFLRLALQQPHAGLVYWHQTKYRIGEAIRRLLVLRQRYALEAMQNRVVFL
jgi:predicted nuclease of predicted toxin-antitoxin system